MPLEEPLPLDQLKARGSWRAQKREKDAKAAAQPERELPRWEPDAEEDAAFSLSVAEAFEREMAGYQPSSGVDWEAFYYDDAIAQRYCRFMQQEVYHTQGKAAGKPFMLEPWQLWFLANLFGWRKKNGARRYEEALLYVPRKNGKTFLGAAIDVALLFLDDEPGAQIYCAGGTRDQARICFSMAKSIVSANPRLLGDCKVYKDAIERAMGGGDWRILRPISSEAKNQHGHNASAVTLDELHAQDSNELYDVLKTSTGARESPLMICLTTSDYDRISKCNEIHEFAGKVRDGIIEDPLYFPVIYEATEEDDWTAEETWRKANPNYGVSIRADYLKKEAKRAKDVLGYQNTFLRLHLNIKTAVDSKWLDLNVWNEVKHVKVNEDDLKGEPCYVGCDLSSTSDLTAVVAVFPDAQEHYRCLSWFWIAKEQATARSNRFRIPYLTWAKEKLITLCPGDSISHEMVKDRIMKIYKDYDVRGVAVDSWNGLWMKETLKAEGILEVDVTSPTTSQMNSPTKEFEMLYLKRALYHGNHKVLNWCASNAVLHTDTNGNVRPQKDGGANKIDGIVACILAIGLARADADPVSQYAGGGGMGFV